jgi:gliding motility-associated lipoprotein GldH
MADEFRIRIEMRQIGARQEAGRIGGIGPCGRELCCTTWMTNFVSVTTNSARFQELSPNPQKLAGQCSKLKCCINFEIDVYHDARKHFPRNSDTLYIKNGKAFHVKNDVFKQLMYYDLVVENEPRIIVPVSIQRVKEVISLNQKDEKPEKLVKESDLIAGPQKTEFLDVLSDSNIERFDKGVVKKKRKKKRRNKSSNGNIGKTLGLLILIALFSFSCNKNRVYQKYIEIPNSVWEVGNVAQYEIDISDTISRHNVFVNIRNSSHYPFRNLWLFITTTAPNGFQDMDTFQVILADPNGKWLGDGLGDIWDSKLAYKKNIRFPQTGTYFMEIEQAMRIDKLPGIMDVGVTVEKFSDK